MVEDDLARNDVYGCGHEGMLEEHLVRNEVEFGPENECEGAQVQIQLPNNLDKLLEDKWTGDRRNGTPGIDWMGKVAEGNGMEQDMTAKTDLKQWFDGNDRGHERVVEDVSMMGNGTMRKVILSRIK